MDVDTGNISELRSHSVLFKLPKDNDQNLQEYVKKTAGALPLFCSRSGGRDQDPVLACFSDLKAVEKCKKKLKCIDTKSDLYERTMKREEKKGEHRLNSAWIALGPISENTTKKNIIDHIKKTGNINVGVKKVYINATRAWIECSNNSEARKLVESLSFSELKGSKLFASIENVGGNQTILVISNLPKGVTEQNVADHIKKFGKIKTPPKSIMLKRNKTNGFVAVNFASKEDALKTMKGINGTQMKGQDVCVWVQLLSGQQQKRLKEKIKDSKGTKKDLIFGRNLLAKKRGKSNPKVTIGGRRFRKFKDGKRMKPDKAPERIKVSKGKKTSGKDAIKEIIKSTKNVKLDSCSGSKLNTKGKKLSAKKKGKKGGVKKSVKV